MRCLIRADATIETGTGHVMRCLTLAEALLRRGHDVTLRGALGGITWLTERVARSGLRHDPAPAHVLGWEAADAAAFDVVVVDSYEFDVPSVNAMARVVPTLAIIDGDDRGLLVDMFLDQNLGATSAGARPTLAGPRFALVRDEFVQRKRDRPRPLGTPPQVLSFMGGSDPTGAIVAVAREVLLLPIPAELTFVVAERWREDVTALVGGDDRVRLVEPTPDLPDLLAGADVAVSATGTSAWEICTIGLPSVFVAVVANQRAGYQALVERGFALGADLTSSSSARSLAPDLRRLLEDASLRERLFRRSAALFDGQGADRVVDALVQLSLDRR